MKIFVRADKDTPKPIDVENETLIEEIITKFFETIDSEIVVLIAGKVANPKDHVKDFNILPLSTIHIIKKVINKITVSVEIEGNDVTEELHLITDWSMKEVYLLVESTFNAPIEFDLFLNNTKLSREGYVSSSPLKTGSKIMLRFVE